VLEIWTGNIFFAQPFPPLFLGNFAHPETFPRVPESQKPIRSALISVYHKTGLDEIVRLLNSSGVTIYSTGGTYTYLEERGISAEKIEDLTSYPSILGGRVKTLHPKVFGGILGRRGMETDTAEMETYEIPAIDLVIVDLYPFEETVSAGGRHEDIIEKIDIGGISLIRAAAKNYSDVLVIPSQKQYNYLHEILKNGGSTTLEQRQQMAYESFKISSHYDGEISKYLGGLAVSGKRMLRYGENPHQKAWFDGKLEEAFEQLHGKELSYNNLVDIDAALGLIDEFSEPTCVIIKHTNPCGLSTADTPAAAWEKALAGDPVSAFGGIIALNREVDSKTAEGMDTIFFEVCAAPSYTQDALDILVKKKNRMILRTKPFRRTPEQVKSVLNGALYQEWDTKMAAPEDLKPVTKIKPSESEIQDLIFANKLVKHAKSNTIVLAKGKQLIGIGVGQTSRVDALRQAIAKAKAFGFSTAGAVMASDAFFPFPDCVEIADKAGIKAVIQPGGSIKDQESIDYCDAHGMAMVTTGTRHFKH
jgi:phosphoribosylaminoimidazolecarboxamide formyltransferase / IMP cyclohydrolase